MQHVQRMVALDHIKPNPRNPHTHSKKQIRQIADSIQAVGFAAPVVIDETGMLLAGHGRLEAAKLLGLKRIPAVVIEGLSEARKRALLLADNRIAQSAGWDRERLADELTTLPELLVEDGLDISVTGFEPAEIDALLVDFEDDVSDPADDIDPAFLSAPAVTRQGDLWRLGKHRLLCGDARETQHLARLMGGERAHMAFLDPPYNLRVRDIVGRGQTKHQEFAMASGEMAAPAFTSFLIDSLTVAARASIDGAVHFVCMDWRHIGELVEAGRVAYGTMLNLIAWVKSNAGQGSFYRSQHELIGVFRVGDSPHLNTIELGRHGRSRSNVWKYAGVNTFRSGRMDDLHAHPTVKPGGGRRDDQSNDAQEPYRVGRGHPPKETRWKPGQSGNPKGRRKKRPSFSEVTERVLNKTIKMRMGDRLLRMSNREALVHLAIRQALAGKPRLLTVLPAIMRYERESLQGQADADLTLTATGEAILADFFARRRSTGNSGNGEENDTV